MFPYVAQASKIIDSARVTDWEELSTNPSRDVLRNSFNFVFLSARLLILVRGRYFEPKQIIGVKIKFDLNIYFTHQEDWVNMDFTDTLFFGVHFKDIYVSPNFSIYI